MPLDKRLTDWFNPKDKKHIKAYRHLMEHGYWPEGFIPENMVIPCDWNITLMAKIADCWINHMELSERYFESCRKGK